MKNQYRTPFSYFDLIETFPKPGCAVCKLLLRDVERIVDGLLYGYTGGSEMHAEFSAARGVCPEHGWLMRRNKLGNVLGIARLYATALEDALTIIDHSSADGNRLHSYPADKLEPTAPCMVCERLDEYEAEYIQMFDRYMADTRFREGFAQSSGLCLPHLRQALRHVQNLNDRQALLKLQSEIWHRLKTQVAQFADKQNYERIHEVTSEEGESWVQAINAMAGEKGVFGMRRRPR
jgi:hypothetical protein